MVDLLGQPIRGLVFGGKWLISQSQTTSLGRTGSSIASFIFFPYRKVLGNGAK